MSRDRIACPCGSGKLYPACCARWHMGPFKLRAPDANELMLSRYTAYALDDRTYLRDTWWPETRPATIDASPGDLKWLGMTVDRIEPVDGDADDVTVHFTARYRVAGRTMRMNESAHVRRAKGRWYYVAGEAA